MSYRPNAAISLLIGASANPITGTRSFSSLNPNGGSIQILGNPGGGNNIGTVTNPAVSSSKVATSYPYIRIVSAGTAGSSAGTGTTVLAWMRGNAAGVGGFRLSFVVGTLTAVAAQSAFFGLQSTNTSSANSPFNYASTDPDQQVDCVGVGYNTGATNLSVMYNDASGTCSTVDLGANFPVDDNSLYRCEFWCAAGSGTSIFYKITRLNDLTTAEGELTSDLPTGGTPMSPRFMVANRATASAVTLALVTSHIQSPA